MNKLYTALTRDFPAPWEIAYHARQKWHTTDHVASVRASNGEFVLWLETFTGDGDVFHLGDDGAIALVDFVNETYKSLKS